DDGLAGEDYTRSRFFCSPYQQDSTLAPHIAMLERAAHFRREDRPVEKLMKLEHLLEGVAPDDVALIAELMSLPTPRGKRLQELTPERRKERTLAALLSLLDVFAAEKPVLMICEDVHWNDATSLELLAMAIEHVARRPALLIITARPEFKPAWLS